MPQDIEIENEKPSFSNNCIASTFQRLPAIPITHDMMTS